MRFFIGGVALSRANETKVRRLKWHPHPQQRRKRKMNPWRIVLWKQTYIVVFHWIASRWQGFEWWTRRTSSWHLQYSGSTTHIKIPKEMLRNFIFCLFHCLSFRLYSFVFSAPTLALAFILKCQTDTSSTYISWQFDGIVRPCPICLRQFCFKCNFTAQNLLHWFSMFWEPRCNICFDYFSRAQMLLDLTWTVANKFKRKLWRFRF